VLRVANARRPTQSLLLNSYTHIAAVDEDIHPNVDKAKRFSPYVLNQEIMFVVKRLKPVWILIGFFHFRTQNRIAFSRLAFERLKQLLQDREM